MHTGKFEDNLDEIIYRGEGNSSIVIALKSQAKVIRLLKKDGKIMKSSQDHHVTQHPMRSLQFIHLIMKPLAEPFLSDAIELIHLKSDFINSLSKRVEVFRPLHRLEKTLLLDDQYALVMNDLCAIPTELSSRLKPDDFCGPTISIEIKPKQGFLPTHKLIMRSTANDISVSRMTNCCLYGSMQYLKLARGRISEMSDYCPISLFSGCPIKMKHALESLISNPQNNLRIFKDLVLAYGETSQLKLSSIIDDFFEDDNKTLSKPNQKPQMTSEERLIELLIQSLLNVHEGQDMESQDRITDFENSYNSSDCCIQHPIKTKCKRCDINLSNKKLKTDQSPTIHRLPKSCVLSSVLKAQRLDTIGAHEALYMLEWLLEDAKLTNEVDILEELSKPQIPKGFGSSHCLPSETKQQYYFRKVWEFLVSLTAKDCSIIVTIRRISNQFLESNYRNHPSFKNHLLKEHKSGNYYLFNVGIADLDQKMPLKIPRICDNLNSILQTNCHIQNP